MGKHAKVEHRIVQSTEKKGNYGHRYRVLLADDDYEMRKLLAWSLKKQGYQVTECKDGNVLMKKVGFSVPYENAQPFDLIISDIRMPGFTGLQVLESARDFEELPPMILITAFPGAETRERAMQLGAVAVVEKPFDVDVLVGNVRRILTPGLVGKRISSDPLLQHSAPLAFEVDIIFRHGKGVGVIRAFIHDMAAKLNPFADHIRKVHVVVEDLSPEAHGQHRHHITIQVAVCDNKPIIISHYTDHADSHENLYLGIRIAFGMARRQLKHSLGKRRAKRFTQWELSQQEIDDESE